ncbi:TIGR04255 family protein [Idiomarina sp. ST10R2A5]|uniref:TIGR04255 family protein n=1 Tax=Idiomarina sp. ST10R2A5 TaxID=3418368 RepID=UPI003EC7EF62
MTDKNELEALNNDDEVFEKPPIKEAVIVIRFESKACSLDLIEEVVKELPEKYSFGEISALSGHSINFTVGKSGNSSLKEEVDRLGIKVTSEKLNLVVQFKRNELVVSKLAPYENWREFKEVGKEIWELYASKLSQLEIKQINLRYINELEIPLDKGRVELSEYLVNEPQTPEGMPVDVCNFFSRVDIPYDEVNAIAVVLQAFKKTNGEYISVILDFNIHSVESEVKLDNSNIWSLFDEYRRIKNKAFLGSITEKSKEMFRCLPQH